MSQREPHTSQYSQDFVYIYTFVRPSVHPSIRLGVQWRSVDLDAILRARSNKVDVRESALAHAAYELDG